MIAVEDTVRAPFRFLVAPPAGLPLALEVDVRVTTAAAWSRYQSRAEGRGSSPRWGAQAFDDDRVVAVRVRSALEGARVHAFDRPDPSKAEGIRRFRGRLLDWLEGAAERVAVELTGGGGCTVRFDTSSGEAVRLVYGPDPDQ